MSDLNRTRICLFGGTFDPIHLGHTHIAAAAVQKLDLDQVIFLPCRQSPHKKGKDHAAEGHRFKMCQLATTDFPWARVDDFDLTAPEPCYSWRTTEAMSARFPDAQLFWLMGTDQWQALPRWNRPEHLAQLVEFIVFTRGDEPTPRDGYTMHSIYGNHPASATEIRRSFKLGRHMDWLHPQIREYIHKHGLYESAESNESS